MPTKKFDRCKMFAKAICKVKGLSYRKMVIKYPRGYEKDSVYIDGGADRIVAHCVHCARTEAISSLEKNRKRRAT